MREHELSTATVAHMKYDDNDKNRYKMLNVGQMGFFVKLKCMAELSAGSCKTVLHIN